MRGAWIASLLIVLLAVLGAIPLPPGAGRAAGPSIGQSRAFVGLAAALTAGWPTATVPAAPVAQAGRYANPELGFSFTYPRTWQSAPGSDPSTLLELTASDRSAVLVSSTTPCPMAPHLKTPLSNSATK